MRAVRCIVIGSAGFDSIELVKSALNRVWRSANHGRRTVDFTFRSQWRDADRIESSTEAMHDLLIEAKHSGMQKHAWIGELHILNMLELKGTRTREWLSIESPDIVVILEHGKHDEWLDPYRKYARDMGATLIQVNQ